MPSLFQRLPLTLRAVRRPLRRRRVALRARRVARAAPPRRAACSRRADSRLPERIALVADFRRLARAGFRTPPTQTVAQCFAGTPLRAIRRGVGAAVHLGAQHAARKCIGADLRQRAAHGVRGIRARQRLPASGDRSHVALSRPRGAARDATWRQGADRRRRARHRARADDGVVLTVDGKRRALRRGDRRRRAASARRGARRRRRKGRRMADAACRRSRRSPGNRSRPCISPMPSPCRCRCRSCGSTMRPGQWVFDRSAALPPAAPEGARGLVAVVISTSGPHDAQDQPTLAARSRCAAASPRRPVAAARLVARDRRAASDVRLHAVGRAPGRGPRRRRPLPRRATTPTPSFRRRSRRRRAAASRRHAHCLRIDGSQSKALRAKGAQARRSPGYRVLTLARRRAPVALRLPSGCGSGAAARGSIRVP